MPPTIVDILIVWYKGGLRTRLAHPEWMITCITWCSTVWGIMELCLTATFFSRLLWIYLQNTQQALQALARSMEVWVNNYWVSDRKRFRYYSSQVHKTQGVRHKFTCGRKGYSQIEFSHKQPVRSVYAWFQSWQITQFYTIGGSHLLTYMQHEVGWHSTKWCLHRK